MRVGEREVELSRTDKVLYPPDGLTKGDVVEHYRAVGDAMLPHLRGRPLTLRRFPDGIDAEGWFQKEASGHFPDWVRVEEMAQRDGSGSVHHVVCDDLATLVYLANQACLELHVWPSTVDTPACPDLLVVDLDPGAAAQLAALRETARRVRDLFERVGLHPFLQATGGRGYHVTAPLDAATGYDTARGLARELADRLAAADPERLTTEQRKDKRGGRIFLDTNRNGYGQTFVAPYSLRARTGGPVATPLDWSELGKAEPNGYSPAQVRARLANKTDPWHGIHARAADAAQAWRQLRATDR